jgi:hypothetical protein
MSIGLSVALSRLLDDFSRARPVIDVLTISNFPDEIPGTGPDRGFVYKLFEEFPNDLQFTIQGQVLRPDRLQAPAEEVFAELTFETADSPGLRDRIDLRAQVAADWRFSFEVAATFIASGARRLSGALSITGGLQAADEPVILEIPTLDWALEIIATSAADLSSRDLIALMRRTALPAVGFDLVTGLISVNDLVLPGALRAARPRLFAREPVKQKRFSAGMRQLRVHGSNVNLSHVLTGIEGGRRLKPGLRLGFLNAPDAITEKLRPETLFTWAGDIAKPLQQIAISRWFSQYYVPGKLIFDAAERACLALQNDAQRIACLYSLSAPRVDLLGDIDGVNLAFVYDPTQPNDEFLRLLRRYYENDSEQRFSLFLERTRPWGSEIGGILASERGVGPEGQPWRRLTADSRTWIAEEISATTQASIFARLVEALAELALVVGDPNVDLPIIFGRILIDPEVAGFTAPDGLPVQQVVGLFVQFVEQGLNEEAPLS